MGKPIRIRAILAASSEETASCPNAFVSAAVVAMAVKPTRPLSSAVEGATKGSVTAEVASSIYTRVCSGFRRRAMVASVPCPGLECKTTTIPPA